MEEILIMITKGIVDDCERTIKARLKKLGDEDLFDLIKTYANGMGLLESYKRKEEIKERVKKELFEEFKKEASRRNE